VVETWDLTPTPLDMLVGFSHEKIGASVADYLHGRGKRRVAAIRGADERAERRSKAFSDAAVRLGMAAPGEDEVPSCQVPAPTTLGSGRTSVHELLERHPDIDAVFCSSDELALGVLIEAQTLGIAVPGKLAVVGFGDMSYARNLQPALTTVRIDGTAIGRTAARFIMDRSEGRPVPEPLCDIGFSIVARDSA
jgi:LacI family gluconate utilization system Gnt-I transcriptional repressor